MISCVSFIHLRSESGDDYYLIAPGDLRIGTLAKEFVVEHFETYDDADSVYIEHIEVARCE